MAEDKLRSIADIARIAGVSKSTVSRALNGSPLVSDDTKREIVAIAKAHNFKPSSIARNLSMRSSRAVAFVTHAYSEADCCVSDPFSLEIMGGIAIGLHELGYDLLIVHIDPEDSDWVGQYLETGKVDGFILMTSNRKRHHIEELMAAGAPFVAWGPGPGGYCTVCCDDRKGGRMATDRLLSLGRRRIAFLGGPRVETEVGLRYDGYAEALTAAGCKVDARRVVFSEWTERGASRAMEELLSRDGSIDAVFVNSDLMAVAALRVLAGRRLRVPEDVAVIGYDNLSLSAYATPALTTVSQNVPLAGKLLARDLISFIEKGIVTTSVLPTELVIRDSA
jgi:DNA-binding LacI/PurR family transcriptional regulator